MTLDVNAATTINVTPSDGLNSNSFNSNTTLTKISGSVPVQGCKNELGVTNNLGSFWIPTNGTGVLGSSSNFTTVLVCDKSTSTSLGSISMWNTFKNAQGVCTPTATNNCMVRSFKTSIAKNVFKDPNNQNQNVLNQFKANGCDTQQNMNLPFCTNIFTQTNSIVTNNIQATVSNTASTANNVEISVFNSTDGNCVFNTQKIIVSAENWLASDERVRCKCVTTTTSDPAQLINLSNYEMKGVYYIDEYGNKKTIYTEDKMKPSLSSSNNNPSWNSAATECLANNNLYYNKAIGGCYNTLARCKSRECSQKNHYYFRGANYSTLQGAQNAAGSAAGSYCARYGGSSTSCLATKKNEYSKEIERCDCSTSYNPNYTPILCLMGQALWANCAESCRLVPTTLQPLTPVTPKSPLAFINVVVNVLFWFAVMLLVLNFITAGIEMVQSGNEPQKMKEATERVQSTIFGFIFVLVVSAVINYLISFVSTAIK